MIKKIILNSQKRKYFMLHAIDAFSYSQSLSNSNFMYFITTYFKNERDKKFNYLMFDDGFESIYTLAFPVLKTKKIKFIVFVVPEFIGKQGYLSFEQINDMLKSGLLILQNHGLTHQLHNCLSSDELIKEIIDSKFILEKLFNVKIEWFAYSHGYYTKESIKLLKKAKYKKAFIASCTPRNVLLRTNFTIPRINVNDKTISDILEIYHG